MKSRVTGTNRSGLSENDVMDTKGRRVWQVGAGDTNRNYGDICLKYDVMIVGPGRSGPFTEELYADAGDIKNSIRRFYGATKGDIILLRIGTGEILAVGELADEEPQWLEAFGDIDGWDLNHVRRVRWFTNSRRSFPSKTLGGQVRTFAGVGASVIHSWLDGLKVSRASHERPLAALPNPGKRLDTKELAERLFIEGLGSEYVDRLTSVLGSIQRVAAWYQNETKKPTGRPSESETVCYLVIPLLFSLGWSEQTCAVEWNHLDVALFKKMPSTDETLECVVEAKLLGRSVFNPAGQARDYAKRTGREGCTRLVVTDGIRYVLHRSVEEEFKVEAYLNILEMRDSYEVFNCAGAVEAILGMAK
jgi:hypothetical protein